MGLLFGQGGLFTPGSHRRNNGGGVINLDKSLGNILIMGNSPQGAGVVMRNYAIDAINNADAVLILRNAANGFSAYPAITQMPMNILAIDVTEETGAEQFDGFANFTDREKDTYMLQLMEQYNPIDPGKKMKYQNYISIVRTLLATRGKKLKLNELYDYNIDEVEMLNAQANIPDMEKMRNERFLNSFRQDIFELETYFYEFANNTVGHILSGSKSLESIFSTKPIVEVSLDFRSHESESNVLLKSIVNYVCKFNPQAAGKSGITVIVDEIPNDALTASGLSRLIKGIRGCNVVYTVADIAKLVEQTNEWVEYADSYFFLTQTSDKNKEFSSAFFGTYEKQKVSTTQGRSTPSFFDMMQGRGATTNTSSQTVTTEKERVYQPEFFSQLPANEAVYFFKHTKQSGRITLF